MNWIVRLTLPLMLGACVAVGVAPIGVTPVGPGEVLPGNAPRVGTGFARPGPIVPGPGCDRTVFDPSVILGRRPQDLGLQSFPYAVRVIPPGTAITMDYSSSRLNLETDSRGIITRFYCG